MLISSFVSGFSLSLSLILAIGAQNAFLLKLGLKKQHVFTACLICALSDAILIALGVAGFGAIVQSFPAIEQLARYFCALFLSIYAAMSFYSAFKSTHVLNADDEIIPSKSKTVLMCLAFTWLNPHVYLDTVVLLGSISTHYVTSKTEFALGAMTASLFFFFSLGYGARVLIPVFTKPVSWKILELVIGFVMLGIALGLIFK